MRAHAPGRQPTLRSWGSDDAAVGGAEFGERAVGQSGRIYLVPRGYSQPRRQDLQRGGGQPGGLGGAVMIDVAASWRRNMSGSAWEISFGMRRTVTGMTSITTAG